MATVTHFVLGVESNELKATVQLTMSIEEMPLKHLYLKIAVLMGAVFVSLASYGEELSLGDESSPVHFVEYGSLTCDYCIDFHRNVLPKIMETYIATGKVRFTYRHYPTSEAALEGAVAVDCSGNQFYEMLNLLFSDVIVWYKATNRQDVFAEQASSIGVDMTSFKRCQANPKTGNLIVSNQKADSDQYTIVGTPTFLINGNVVKGKKTFEALSILIDKAILANQ